MQKIPPYTPPSTSLSEDEVKRRFMPFLRDFYKNRYEPVANSVSTDYDSVSIEGWVADGKITFRKPDGDAFICTFEATSRDKVAEVKFQLNFQYFLWDCTAFALVCAALTYAFFYEINFVPLVKMGWLGNIGLLLGTGMVAYFTWFFAMRGWRKYRYIFAIQQFKQYFADEQWVALAGDVFPGPTDPYLMELRNQCIYHGIGLAIVPLEGPVRKVIDPSRLGIFGKDRKMTQWVTRADWYQSFSQNVETMVARRPKVPDAFTALGNKMYRPLHYLVVDPFKRIVGSRVRKPIDQGATVYARFMSAQTVQKWVAALAFSMIALLFYRVSTFQEMRIGDLEGLELRTANGQNPEDLYGPQIDQEIIPANGIPTGVPKQYPIAKDTRLESEDNVIQLSSDASDPYEENSAEKDLCGALNGRRGGYFIQDNGFPAREPAQARMNEIRENGDLSVNIAPQSCLGANRTGWLVWIGQVYPNEAKAQQAADEFALLFQRYGLQGGRFLVRPLP